MRFRTSYYAGSGPSYEDCHFLAQRYDEVAGFRLFESECWVMRNLPDDDDDGEVLTQDLFGTQSWLTGLWRAPSGEVFVSDSDGVVHHLLAHGDDDEDDDWVEHPIDCTLFGVHGRAADDVWTWGDAEDDRPALFHWDGDDWREIPGPDFAIVSLHAAGDLLWAAGRRGAVAVRDAGGWRRVPTDVQHDLTCVFAASPDEVYAVGQEGAFLVGDRDGLRLAARGPGEGVALQAVAKHDGVVWVGGHHQGLLRWDGAELVLEKPGYRVADLDARGALVVTEEESIIGRDADGAWWGAGDDALAEARGDSDLGDW
ncbi:MAG: hypothetical protein KC635_27260 [Myxococcales bacterium]|nr:hypothetical protein [Myxococcales bacterium]